jgi:hypothetical protein
MFSTQLVEYFSLRFNCDQPAARQHGISRDFVALTLLSSRRALARCDFLCLPGLVSTFYSLIPHTTANDSILYAQQLPSAPEKADRQTNIDDFFLR